MNSGTSITLNLPEPSLVTPNLDGPVTVTATDVGALRSLRDHIYNAGRTVIGTSDPDLGVFQIDIVSQAGHSSDLSEAVS
jgi:hypothetical protein